MYENNNNEVAQEILILKSSQIRIKSLEYILSFYENLRSFIFTFGDVFENYKENFEHNKAEYQKDIEDIFKDKDIEDHSLMYLLSRSEEKTLLLMECIQFITQSIKGTIQPKRKGVQDTRKITKARLLETIKFFEQYVLSIQENSSQFISKTFIETQKLRTLFMLDAMHQLLEITAVESRLYPFLFQTKTILMLEESSSSANRFSIVKHQKRRNTVIRQYYFYLEFMERFLLSFEKSMRKES